MFLPNTNRSMFRFLDNHSEHICIVKISLQHVLNHKNFSLCLGKNVPLIKLTIIIFSNYQHPIEHCVQLLNKTVCKYNCFHGYFRWVHLVCALYTPGVAFGDVDKLSPVTLFEMPYSKWGLRVSIVNISLIRPHISLIRLHWNLALSGLIIVIGSLFMQF